MTDRDLPRRRVVVEITIGADSWEAAGNALRHVGMRLDERAARGEGRVAVTSGGVDYGFQLDANEDPEVTHESYFEAVNQMLADRRDS